MPRRTHTEQTRRVYDSHATFEGLYDDLRRQWAKWQQRDAEQAKAREQQKRINQFRNTYVN